MANNDTIVILKKLYPVVSKSLDTNSRKFIGNIAQFLNRRHEELHAIAPYTRVLFNQREVDNIFISLNLREKDIENILKECYFWNKPINPQCVKEPYVEVLFCSIIYFLNNNQQKNAELTTLFLCFSGKFYASLHSKWWKYPPKENVMDYVVNNMLSDKYDLKKEGTLFKAIQKLSITWINTYSSKLNKTSNTDDDVKILIQQLRDRVNSFLGNIASLYYEAIENKNYLNYETDNLDDDSYRLAPNDATTAARITASAVSLLTSQKISIDICNKCLYNITTIKNASELCDIMEGIVSDKENIPQLRRVINIIICDFMANRTNKNAKVGGADFISYSIKAKPNTKSTILIEMKTTISNWLNSYSVRYKQRQRAATRNDYYRAVLMYFILTICKVANK